MLACLWRRNSVDLALYFEVLPRAFRFRRAAVRAIFTAVRSAGLLLIRPIDLQLRPALSPQGAAPYALVEESVRFSAAINGHLRYSLVPHVSLSFLPNMRGFLIVPCLVGGLGLPPRLGCQRFHRRAATGACWFGGRGLGLVHPAGTHGHEHDAACRVEGVVRKPLEGGPPGLVQILFDLPEFNEASQLLRDLATGEVPAIVRCLPELTAG